jgi:hypothetical protein
MFNKISFLDARAVTFYIHDSEFLTSGVVIDGMPEVRKMLQSPQNWR